MFMFLRTPPTLALANIKSSSRISTIWPGIPKHIGLLSLVFSIEHVRQHRLAQSEPAVVGRYTPVPVDLEPFLLQQSYHLPEQKHVLKSPPGERDGACSPDLPDLLAARNDHLGHRPVEPGSYFPHLTSG